MILSNSGTFFTLIFSQSAIALWLKLQYYMELVLLIEQGSPQPLDKTLTLLWAHNGGFGGVGEFV